MLGVVGLTGTDGLQVLGGHTAPDFTGGNLGALQHQGTGGNDGAFAHLAVVEQRSSHADECAVVDGAGVNGDGSVDVQDVVLTVNYVIGRNPENFIRNAADMNKDGDVDVQDVVLLVNKVIGKT